MHSSLGSWRRWKAALAPVLFCVGCLIVPLSAAAQAKDSLEVVPGGAFAVLDVRLAEFAKTDFFALLPEEAQREFRTRMFSNPLHDKPLSRATLVFLELRDLIGRKEKIYAKTPDGPTTEPDPGKGFDPKEGKDPGFKEGKDLGPAKPKVLRLEDLDEKALLANGGPLQVLVYDEPIQPRFFADFEKTMYKGKTVFARVYGPWITPVDERTIIVARGRSELRRFLDGTTPEKGGLAPLLARVKKDKAHGILAINAAAPSADKFRKQLAEMLEDEFGFFPFGSLFEPLLDMDHAYLSLNMAGRPKLEGSATFHSAKEATRALENLRDAGVILRVLGVAGIRQSVRYAEKYDFGRTSEEEMIFLRLFADELEAGLRAAKLEQEKNTVTLAVQARSDAGALKAAITKLAKEWAGDPKKVEARLRRQSNQNLRQIGVALHSFENANRNLPPQAICDPKSGKSLLSWRVAILPYIEQVDLYRQFKLDEPWDSAHNIKLLDRMPPLYAPVAMKPKEKNVTFYQGLAGPGTMFQLTKDPANSFGARGPGLSMIPDGTANTFMVVEAGTAVPWSKPEDLVYDPAPKSALPKLGGMFKDGFHVLFGDASVSFVRLPIPDEELRAGIDGRDGRAFHRRFEER